MELVLYKSSEGSSVTRDPFFIIECLYISVRGV